MSKTAYTQLSIRELLSRNITYLMDIYGLSRKDLSARLDIPYTTLCDWLKARSYPRIDSLELMAEYFHIEIDRFFTDIQSQQDLTSRLESYARSLDMKKDYSHLYPDGFFDLFGCISDSTFMEPEDIPVLEDIESL